MPRLTPTEAPDPERDPRFPREKRNSADYSQDVDLSKNLAAGLFGHRIYADQTVLEYLAEFLLVAAAPKTTGPGQPDSAAIFPDVDWKEGAMVGYRPVNRIPLKMLACFTASKLETRHEAHRKAFEQANQDLLGQVDGETLAIRQATVRAMGTLFNGFVGVAGNRTWVAQSFLPASRSLLAREVMWRPSRGRSQNLKTWDEVKGLFTASDHNFFARGGEHLYLQLAQLFARWDDPVLVELRNKPEYGHLPQNGDALRDAIETGLMRMLDGPLEQQLGPLVQFITDTIGGYLQTNIDQPDSHDEYRVSRFGWIPASCLPEALLFASELANLLNPAANLDPLARVEHVQNLCAFHILRTMSFLAARYAPLQGCEGFVGGYAWVPAPPEREPAVFSLATQNFKAISNTMQRALRGGHWPAFPTLPLTKKERDKTFDDADKQGHKLFAKLGKSLGVVVPLRGRTALSEARLILPPPIVAMLVAALIPPGQRMRESVFLTRLFRHYGLAIAPDDLARAYAWTAPDAKLSGNWPPANWFSEALHASGYLIPLSDAVSVVQNPT